MLVSCEWPNVPKSSVTISSGKNYKTAGRIIGKDKDNFSSHVFPLFAIRSYLAMLKN